MDSTRDTVFLGKFTFAELDENNPGQLLFDAQNISPALDALQGKIKLNFYTDESDEIWYFPDIWENNDLTCKEKVAFQHDVGSSDLGIKVNGSSALEFSFYDSNVITWYWTVSDCEMLVGQFLQMNVRMHWTNPGGWWYREFSVEDQNLLTIYMIFSAVYSVFTPIVLAGLFIFYIRRNREIDKNNEFFVWNLLLRLISNILYLLHYFTYAGDGIGIPGFLVGADVLDNLSMIVFMVALIQVASLVGSPLQLHRVTGILCGTCWIFYIGFFLWQEVYPGLHPTVLAYKWETPPGVILILIQLTVWTYFLGLGTLNAIRNPDRRRFLIPFLIIFTIWFISLPILVSFLHLAPYYYRWKWVLGVTQTIYFLCFIFYFLSAIPNPLSRLMRGDDGLFAKRSVFVVDESPSIYDDL